MNIEFEKKSIQKEIAFANDVISQNNFSSVLSNILLSAKGNELLIKASDIKLNFEKKLNVDVLEEGDLLINCSKFLSILNLLEDGMIELSEKENEVEVNVIVDANPVKKVFRG